MTFSFDKNSKNSAHMNRDIGSAQKLTMVFISAGRSLHMERNTDAYGFLIRRYLFEESVGTL